MRKLMLCLVLTGCATTQQSIQVDGARYEHWSQQTPQRAAACLSRVLEEATGYGSPSREGSVPGTWDVSSVYPGGLMAYAIAAPIDGGSSVTLWVKSTNIFKDSIAAKAKGC